ncbi:NapH/MauN family ferredoxin-type protein [Geomonas oryzisoli]|uniref:NapH/MauN family ferredoxin-type protein n=1 Tax=Geomonas oryzisoli TaxID=2847992 RepID=A0ABX8J5Y0_9BACT|nr:NapH/MauN family ferredoxin-type protein [Geomonas oryzisoli]QWV93223.1 NapH/MauN family ferredoxin-type protein [Geomonas oryzisoli]
MTSRWWLPRRSVQIGTLLLIASPAAGFTFFKGNLASAELAGVRLSDPLACLQAVIGSGVMIPSYLFGALLVTVGYFVLGGRSFCGWVCPVGFFTELGDKLRRRVGTGGTLLPLATGRYALAAVLGVVAATGVPLFEVLSPIGIVGRAVAFASLVPLLFPAAILVVELTAAPRVWCRSLCPLGAFYALLARFSPLKVSFDRARCTGCGDCVAICPVPEVLDPLWSQESCRIRTGDCTRCLACIDSCAERALKVGFHLK